MGSRDTLARQLSAPAGPSQVWDNRIRLLAEYHEVLNQLATAHKFYSAAQERLDAAREDYISLEAQLGFIPKV